MGLALRWRGLFISDRAGSRGRTGLRSIHIFIEILTDARVEACFDSTVQDFNLWPKAIW